MRRGYEPDDPAPTWRHSMRLERDEELAVARDARLLSRGAWVGSALVALLFIARACAAEAWTGSVQWRGETIRVESCCGPVRAPVLLRELERGRDGALADLRAAGVRDVELPALGAPGFPYTIRIERNPVFPSCPPGADCPGGSFDADPRKRHRWTLVVVRDKLARRLAPVAHEVRHRWCVAGVRVGIVPPRTIAELRANASECAWADHPAEQRIGAAGRGYRYDIAGRLVPAGKR